MGVCLDPLRSRLLVSGVLITGFTKGTFIEIEQGEDSTTIHKGGQGDNCFVIDRDRSGSIKVKLKSTSPYNAYFTLLNELSLAAGKTFPVVVDSDNGGYLATECMFKKDGKMEVANEITDREWEINCLELVPKPKTLPEGISLPF